MTGRDVGDYAFVECNLLHLTSHAALIDQETVHLGHPHQRVLLSGAGVCAPCAFLSAPEVIDGDYGRTVLLIGQ